MSRCLFTILVLLFWLCPVFGANVTDNDNDDDNDDQHNAINALQLMHSAKTVLQQHLVSTLVLANTSNPSHCSSLLHAALHASTNSPQFEWMLQMYDSTGSLPSGLLSGTFTSLGDFDQCVRIAQHYPKFYESRYATKYCMLTVNVKRKRKYQMFNWNHEQRRKLTAWEGDTLTRWLVTDNRVPLTIGLCLPESCAAPEVVDIANQSISLLRHFDFNVDYCQGKPKLEEQIENLLPIIFLLGFLVSMCLMGSMCDVIVYTQIGRHWSDYIYSFTFVKVMRCFSLVQSVPSLYDITDHKRDMEPVDKFNAKTKPLMRIDVLDGIRVFSILWILGAHVAAFSQVLYLMKVSPVAHYPHGIVEMKEENWLMSSYLQSTYLAVSVFFLVSGMLLVYKKDSVEHCNSVVHFFKYIAHRVLRITPTLLVIMALTYHLQFAGTGPMFHPSLIAPFVEPCRQYFWHHLFFVHNFLDTNQRCGSHTWYLAADFQLQLIGFFLLHLARCRKQKIWATLAAFIIMAASSLFSIATIMLGFGKIVNFDAYIDSTTEVSNSNFRLFYYSTHMHAGSFFVGVVLGLLLTSGWSFKFLFKKQVIRVGLLALSVASLWVVPLAMRVFVFASPASALSVVPSSPMLTGVYFQFLYYVFNISLAGLIFITVHNPKMPMSRMLASKWLRPLSRLVFSIYLIHQILIWFTLQQLRSPMFVTSFKVVTFVLMIGALSFFGANVLYLTVEYPFIKLSKLLMLDHNKRARRKDYDDGCGLELDRSSSLFDVTTTAADRIELDNARGKAANFDDDGMRHGAGGGGGGEHTVAVTVEDIDRQTSS